MHESHKYYAKQKSICHIKVQKLAELIYDARTRTVVLGGGSNQRENTKRADKVLFLDLVTLICLFPLQSHQAMICALYYNVCCISRKSNKTNF